MSSKEALEELYDGYQYGMAGRSFYDIIKKDLERLEVLEKENKIIKQSYFELGEAYAKILESNEKYSEENEELKEKIERMKKIEKYNLRMFCDNPDLD